MGTRSKLRCGLTVGLLWLSYSLVMSHSGMEAMSERASSSGWKPESAAKYLDDRMDLWFTKSKKLRTGDEKTSCVSCHMTIPYILARPALRKAMDVRDAVPQENRIIEETRLRVETWGRNQSLYDHDEKKKLESKGTEAVLNAFILAAAQNQPGSNRHVQRAFEQLWETQRSDGAWDWLDFGLEPFETADSVYFGATLAAIAVGASYENASPKATAGADRLHDYLKGQYGAQSLLNRIWVLLASVRATRLLPKTQREALIQELRTRQGSDGGWAMSSLGPWKWSKSAELARAPGATDPALLAQADGYATGLIIYALHQAGFPSSDPAIRRGLQWLKDNQREIRIDQQEWIAWRSYSLNFDREHGGEKGEPWRRMFMSDAATAFAALAIAAAEPKSN